MQVALPAKLQLDLDQQAPAVAMMYPDGWSSTGFTSRWAAIELTAVCFSPEQRQEIH